MSNDIKSTEFVMNRDFVVSGFGHSIAFVKDVPMRVPALLHTEVMRCGALPLNEEAVAHVQKSKGRQPEVQGEEREDTVIRAMDALVDGNDRMSFGADGLPALKAIFRLTGIDLQMNERNAIWVKRAKRLNAKADPNNSTITKEETAEIATGQAEQEAASIEAEGEALVSAEGPGTDKVVLAEEEEAPKKAPIKKGPLRKAPPRKKAARK